MLILLVAVFAAKLTGQDTKQQQRQMLAFIPPDPSAPVPGELLRKLPVQITLSCKVNGNLQDFVGTGFLVGIDVPPVEKGMSFLYLVTNRHVAECWDERNHPQDVVSSGIRVNKRDSTAVTLPLSTNGNANWYFADDDSVDLAVTTLFVTADQNLDAMKIGFESFATRDSFRQHRIGEGSTIMITGYFVQFPGERRFQPILRQGTLSMIPDEPMKTTTGKLGTVYLADVHILGGNSGSPVIAIPQDDITHMGDHWFIGLVSGYYLERAGSRMEIATTVYGETAANSGVAIIVPADEVKKLIEGNPVLKRFRDAYLLTLPKENPPPSKIP
jgi:hypothetical protein